MKTVEHKEGLCKHSQCLFTDTYTFVTPSGLTKSREETPGVP